MIVVVELEGRLSVSEKRLYGVVSELLYKICPDALGNAVPCESEIKKTSENRPDFLIFFAMLKQSKSSTFLLKYRS